MDTDMILSRARFTEIERRLFIAQSFLQSARAYVNDVARDLGPKSESARLLASIDIFLEGK